MNKTININLAGSFFHVDENAYAHLQKYLDAVRATLSPEDSIEEIMNDIEARIAELFSESMTSNDQVITLSRVKEIIDIMGQPQDFDPEGAAESNAAEQYKSIKQLFRDEENKYLGGVASGLGHYLGIDCLWIRLIWLLLFFFSSGTFFMIYILFWILVPAAKSTSDKLKMKGEPINISNIEKRVKEGYDKLSDNMKSVDYDKYGNQVKRGSNRVVEVIGNLLKGTLTVLAKLLGVLMLIFSITTLLGLAFGLFSAGSLEFWGQADLIQYYQAVSVAQIPFWALLTIVFLAVGIPFIVLFIVGLKLLIPNLKSMGWTPKILIFALWIASILALIFFGAKHATFSSVTGQFQREIPLPISKNDSLTLTMNQSLLSGRSSERDDDFKIKMDADKNPIIVTNNVRLIVRSTQKEEGFIKVDSYADGATLDEAQDKAMQINYQIQYTDGVLELDPFLTTDLAHKYRDQHVEVIVYLPTGSVLWADHNTHSYHQNTKAYNDLLDSGYEGHYLKVMDRELKCLDCPSNESESGDSDAQDIKNINIEIQGNIKTKVNRA
ncbi:MAG: PspC domain-containing protein [Flavobacteriaceae bacterium]|nr:PspC domain-containing protein [Flavobacteriaceae bacterium]